jgi:N-acetylglucosamine kinase-like BadF-type ATPase
LIEGCPPGLDRSVTRSPRLAIGIDAGATNSRCLVVDEAGARLARGSADGANQNSSADPGQALSTALRTALTRLESEPRGRVGQVTVGIAGAGPAGLARASAVARQACVAAGIADAALSVSSDIEIAYAAGCSAPDGTVLIAGTGAVAAAIEEFSVVRRRDGLGYLLGDAGSAVWIGLAAVRAVAAADEGRGPATALSATVLELVHAETPDLPGEPTQALVTAVYGSPPAALGRFAPLVERAAADGDEVAAGIVRSAMSALAATVAGVRGRGRADLPLVVAGAVATGDGLLGTSLRARLRDEFGVAPLRAQDGVVGAAFLALRQLPGVRAGALCALVEG